MKLPELETFFATAKLPQTVKLPTSEVIEDVPKCVESHLQTLRANSGNRTFLPFYDRLMYIRSEILLRSRN
jgi:hypothetical protein